MNYEIILSALTLTSIPDAKEAWKKCQDATWKGRKFTVLTFAYLVPGLGISLALVTRVPALAYKVRNYLAKFFLQVEIKPQTPQTPLPSQVEIKPQTPQTPLLSIEEYFPDEILCLIVEKLETKDIPTVARLSKRFNAIVQSTIKKVSVDKLVSNLLSRYPLSQTIDQNQRNRAEENIKRYLKALINNFFENKKEISTNEFSTFLAFFPSNSACQPLKHMVDIVSEIYFHGKVSENHIKTMINRGPEEGRYLVRYSNTKPGAFVFSYLAKREGQLTLFNVRIQHDGNGLYTAPNHKDIPNQEKLSSIVKKLVTKLIKQAQPRMFLGCPFSNQFTFVDPDNLKNIWR